MIKPVDNDLLQFFDEVRGIRISLDIIARLLVSRQESFELVDERLDKLEESIKPRWMQETAPIEQDQYEQGTFI